MSPARGTVGLALGSALYIAAVLGTGILVLPSLAAAAAGPASLVAVLVVALLSIPLAGTFAALASHHPDAGGVSTAVGRSLGPTAARMTGYWFFFGVGVGIPVVGTLGAEYVVAAAGLSPAFVPVVASVLLVPPFLANAVGLRLAGPVQLVLSAILVALVVIVIVVAAPAVDTAALTPFAPHGWAGIGTAISLFVWAFAGWEAVTHTAGEFRSPRRTIPIATAIAVVVVSACYLGLQWLTVTVLGDRAGGSSVPLLDLVETGLPGTGRIGVAVVATIVAVGVLNAYLAAFAKLGASLARDGSLPRWFAPGAEPGGVPRRALMLVLALTVVYFTALVLLDGELQPFILVHTSSMVAVYLLGVIAALRLLDRYTAGWWMAAVSTVLVAGLVLLAGIHLLVAGILAAAAVIVTLAQRRRRNP